ncbi:hypothetical protein EV659_1185 [Rhodothalassium salexigens DSM 2132]|uniref:Uncharacterized protein n=1 Tax=Rhodothalassium salexigens DSM 2132 TaxID=1188247 RepID=A0A4R2P7A2_RHOSA|nr:hypothetical protein [Rhodothalassium salexigens]MBB4212802.1 hypothetical protein [Rhodothalassium salexigens DSM 2132]MBK1638943.1 hypothetical protein [Rhodothalassium salexigens DSM 2132]TCP29695.1 hypothetical protein EV659_1185 [Rhodothalassium salexigens DSM 2132]
MAGNPPFWLVWNPQGVRPPRYRHTTFAGAKAEAERLVRICPGNEFYVLAAAARARRVDVQTDVFIAEDDDEIPF